MTLELPDEMVTALKAMAAARGLTLEGWFKELVRESPEATSRCQHAAAAILELQKHVQPDPDGWTVRDYIRR